MTADWTIIDEPVVADVLSRVAAAIGRKASYATTADDAHQEGSIWLALHADQVRDYLLQVDGPRFLYRRLHDRVLNAMHSDLKYADQVVAIDLNDAA